MNDILSLNPWYIFSLRGCFFIAVVFQANHFWTDMTGTDMSVPAAQEKQRNSDWTVITWLGFFLHLTGCFLFQPGCGIGFLGNKTVSLTFLMFCTSILLMVQFHYISNLCLVIGPPIIQSEFLLFTAAKTYHLQPKFPLKGLLQLQQPEYIRSGPVYHIG